MVKSYQIEMRALIVQLFLSDFAFKLTPNSSASWAKTAFFHCSVMLLDVQQSGVTSVQKASTLNFPTLL